MPGSAYYNIGKYLCQFVSRIPECNINTNTKDICETLKEIELEDDEELISFDVSSLYTNVPVMESIRDVADLLYRPMAKHGAPNFSKETFIELATIASCNVVMLTHDGYYKQIEGLAMGAPLAPYLANAWMSKFDPLIASIIEENPEMKRETEESDNGNSSESSQTQRSSSKRQSFLKACENISNSASQNSRLTGKQNIADRNDEDIRVTEKSRKILKNCKKCNSDCTCKKSKLYKRYMDDIITALKVAIINAKLQQINNLHPALKFTHEREIKVKGVGKISVLDMMCLHEGKHVETTWYCKDTDTGLVLNYHALAPEKYKKGVIIGMIYRIYRACSSWKHIAESLDRARKILKNNQYPEDYIENTIKETLDKILTSSKETEKSEKEKEEHLSVFLNYRGKVTVDYAKRLKKICKSRDSPAFEIPIKIIYTMRKLKTLLPSLKSPVPKMLKSDVIYKLNCSVCNNSYVGQTERHATTRFTEHILREGPIKEHLSKCKTEMSEENVEILKEMRSNSKLLTYEALFIKEINPKINTREEFRSKKLTAIKWVVDSLYSRGDSRVN